MKSVSMQNWEKNKGNLGWSVKFKGSTSAWIEIDWKVTLLACDAVYVKSVLNLLTEFWFVFTNETSGVV